MNPLTWQSKLVIIGGVFLVGMTAGGWAVKQFYNAGKIAQLEADVVSANKARKASDEALTWLSGQYGILANEKPKYQIQEVIKYVKQNPDCDLTRGAVSLLNSSWGVPEPTPLSTGEEQTISTITQPAEISHNANNAVQCRAELARCDAVRDWWLSQQTGGVK